MNTAATNYSNLSHDLSIDEVLYSEIPVVFIVGRYVHMLWYLIGFVGNVISAVIWNTPHMYNVCSVAHYLVTISVCDVICQFLDIYYYLRVFWQVEYFKTPVLCEVWSILYMIPLYISELLMLGYTVEKLISIRNPFRSGWFTRHQRAPKDIVWIVVSVTALSIPQAYFWKVDNRGYCDDNRHSEHLWYPIWHWVLDSGIYVLVPCAVILLSCLIVREAKRSIIGIYGKARDPVAVGSMSYPSTQLQIRQKLRQSTVVLLRLSYYRVFSLAPYTITYFLENHYLFKPSVLPRIYTYSELKTNAVWMRYVTFSAVKFVCRMISASRNAVSVLIFTYSSKHFKAELQKRIFHTRALLVALIQTAVSRIVTNLRSLQEDS